MDCSHLNWNSKVQKIDNIIAAWRQRDLSYKGKALIINSLLTSSLWYNVTSLSVPSWVITQMEQAVYNFFWGNKHPLVNRDLLALPLKEGGFNIPRLGTKVQAFRLNTLKRLLSGEDTHWKCFTAYFLRISEMELGKLSLVLDYPLQRIDRGILAFHKELLSAWLEQEPCRLRINVPTTVTDILSEPLFLNRQITLHNELLFLKDWIAAGIIRIRDICYEVVPGFLPVGAIHEILADQIANDGRTLEKTSREFNKILSAIPQQRTNRICLELRRPPPTLQPCFAIRTKGAGQIPSDILSCKTRHLYGQLHDRKKPVVPAIGRWKASLQPEPVFSSKQWMTLYSPLISNKQGHTNWKIAHRVLLTALSLNRMGLLDTPNCHRCGSIENIEHALLECRVVNDFWGYVEQFIRKLSENKLVLSPALKMLGKVPSANDPVNSRAVALINWVLTLARCTICKSATHLRMDNACVLPEAIFSANIKAHLKYQFSLYSSSNLGHLFPTDWCIGNAFAKVENNRLVFNF